MATPAQIEQQYNLEREAIRCGIEKLKKNTQQLMEREYASATIFGCSSISAAQTEVANELLKTFSRINKGQAGAKYVHIAHHLLQFNDAEQVHVLANIALKRTFDLVFSRKKKSGDKPPNFVQDVTLGIGSAVEAECQIRWYESQDKDLFKNITKKYWLNTTGTRQKQTVAQLMMNRHDYHWDTWSTDTRSNLGAWLLDTVCRVTNWFTKQTLRSGKKTNTLIVPTDAYSAIQDQLMDEAALYAPLSWPMLIPPNNWTNERAGGYLLNEVQRGNELVRHGNPTLKQPEIPLEFLNQLQGTAYRVCPFIYGVAKHLQEKGYKLGKFKPYSAASLWVLPNKPPDIETNEEARQAYKRERTQAENEKKKYERSLHVKTTATLELADKFINYEKYYLPWSFDYRGRTYCIPQYLTPHDTDFGKSLVRFYEEAFLTPEAEDWLAFQVATTYGLDKKPIRERLDWARDNHSLITLIACDPIGSLSEWESADEPWQFLASCKEYYDCLIACTKQSTGLPVAVDATCSGLQILAGLAKDAGCASLVNVLPSDRPQDAYMTVLNAMEGIPERLLPYMDRSVTKRSVMTIPYNATESSSREYIAKALKENMPKDMERVSYKEADILAKSLRAAMNEVAPGPLAVMEWIGLEMRNCIKRGDEFIQWQTPSGFIVYQKRNKYDKKRMDCKLLGRTAYWLVTGVKGPDAAKHKSCGAPNLIHSLDASLLHLSFKDFNAPFTVIHDSVWARATDMSTISERVRETYMHLFAEHEFLLDFAKQIKAETEPPMVGTLNPESVIESTYFFC